jgi:F-type H+-transporting ATPase subunit b
MLIDWFTVSAQAMNFLILVWLMKRFLYHPILNAIDAREKFIETALKDANAKKNEAKQERDAFMKKNAEFDQRQAASLSQAKDEVKVERERLMQEAKEAADLLSVKRHEALNADIENLNQSIHDRAKQEVFTVVRKTLSDLATVSLEERIGEVFTRRLHEMDDHSKETMQKALNTSSSSAIIRSTFELPVNQREAIQNALNETFLADIPVNFETSPDLISGIELISNGQRLAWSIEDYLSMLEKDVIALLKDKKTPDTKTKPIAKSTLVTKDKVEDNIKTKESKPKAKPKSKKQSKVKTKVKQ